MYPLENFIFNDWGHVEINPPSRRGKIGAKYSKTYNNNNIFTLDTETTSLYHEGLKCSFVYVTMLSINGVVYYTRNMIQLKTFLDKYDTPGTINVIYVHNLGFDFSFLQNVLEFDKVFARKPHRVIFARYKSWEFRCSYFLSQMSLRAVGDTYDLPHGKLVDGLDYGKIRNCDTPFTETEEDYMELDCIVLHEYVQKMLRENGGNYRDIPYTQTGFVRKYTLEYVKNTDAYYKFRNNIKKTLPSPHVFEILEKCFAGGYTHANYWTVAEGIQTNVKSYDFTSSYPAVMCRCKFPVGIWRQIDRNYRFYVESDKYCCIGRFRLENVQAKSNLCYLSKHKCIRTKNPVVNNGRIFTADEIIICLTDVDIKTVKMMYDCRIIPLEMYVSDADYLPREFIMSILQLYKNKTQYKNVFGKEAIYLSSKQMVNSEYGMCAFNPYTDKCEWLDGEWSMNCPVFDDVVKYYKNRKTILPYAWGVFVTAWARNKLCNICSKIGNDVLYMDTDSIKFKGDHDKLFEEDNQLIHSENIAMCERLKIHFDLFAPADQKGKTHELGLWDFEHVYKSFKVLGAKRYCYTLYYEDDKKCGGFGIYPVVAGCPTDALRTWLKLHNCNALLKPFRLDTFLNKSESGKSTVFYHKNHDINIPVRDYLGHTKIEHIGYGAHVEPASFDMSLHDSYFAFLSSYAVDDKSELTRNGVLI